MYADDYVENGVLNADPIDLVCMLYSKAVQKLHLALERLEAEDIYGRSTAIAHAMEIIVELQGSLDLEKGGELARELADLYCYCQQRLGEANAQQKAEPIEEVIKLLSLLGEGWQECRVGFTLEEIPADITVEPERAMSQAWTV